MYRPTLILLVDINMLYWHGIHSSYGKMPLSYNWLFSANHAILGRRLQVTNGHTTMSLIKVWQYDRGMIGAFILVGGRLPNLKRWDSSNNLHSHPRGRKASQNVPHLTRFYESVDCVLFEDDLMWIRSSCIMPKLNSLLRRVNFLILCECYESPCHHLRWGS